MLTAKRKNHLSAFSLKTKLPTALLLTLLFCLGFWISLDMRWMGAALYLLLWIGSYGVIYAGTCRNCVYYGKSCPIPLEESCVHRFFSPGRGRFGVVSLLWATLAYVMRVFLPLLIVVNEQSVITSKLDKILAHGVPTLVLMSLRVVWSINASFPLKGWEAKSIWDANVEWNNMELHLNAPADRRQKVAPGIA